MTPQEFQTVALAWIGVTGVVGAAAIAAGWTLYQNVKQRLNFHRDDIKTLTDDVKVINRALPTAVPAPTQTPAPETVALPAQAPLTPAAAGQEAGFPGVIPTSASPSANLSQSFDRADVLAKIEAVRQSVAAAEAEGSPGPAPSAVEGEAPVAAPKDV